MPGVEINCSLIMESKSLIINNIEINYNNHLDNNFFNQSCLNLAKNLLGKYLIRKLSNGEILIGKIVETEAYEGIYDKASHSYNNNKTKRNEPMFMKYGTIYVYFTYGMYHCFNISSLEIGSAVLIRSLEPIYGIDTMMIHREQFNKNRINKNKQINESYKPKKESNDKKVKTNTNNQHKNNINNKNKKNVLNSSYLCNESNLSNLCNELNQSSENSNKYDLIHSNSSNLSNELNLNLKLNSGIKIFELCNGPSKLCISMDIRINNMNKENIMQSSHIWIQDSKQNDNKIVTSERIGLGASAKEWKNKLLRFYIFGNKCVSKIDKSREKEMGLLL